jgi:hypothetical protein
MKIDPQYIRMDYSVRLLHHLLMYFEDKYGRDEPVKFIRDTGMPLEYFNDKNNWVSYDKEDEGRYSR